MYIKLEAKQVECFYEISIVFWFILTVKMSDEVFKENELYRVTEKPSTINLIFDLFL